ncbi:MAG TPA: mechanosensitive ion channel domain-containing protein [Pyrinomonadaceae bacterium]|nr:mechanosensitive ion channel domain-containing protein [Pyrinomonadaceae bacterium]
MKATCILLAATILLIAPLARGQQAASTEQTAPQAVSSSSAGEPAPLVFWNRRITVFRSYVDQLGPAERAKKAAERLSNLPDVAPEWRINSSPAVVGQYSGVMISVNDQFAFAILTTDVDVDSNETMQAAVDHATSQLRVALEARAQQHSLPVLLKGLGLSLVATIILLFGLWLVIRGLRIMKGRLEQTASARAQKIAPAGFNLQPSLNFLSRALTSLTAWALAVVLVYLWLTYVLLRFPYTAPWGQQLGAFVLALLGTLGTGIVQSIPGMFTVIVIFLLTRLVTRVVSGIFDQVEKGDLNLAWLHPDTARATRYLVVILIWIFSITVAYPYIPGSDTSAFKGVSVLVGVMISLGSAGLINQVMSGLVVVYSRALKPGELVQIGDDFGVVTHVGMLSTKLITRKKEEITIPNAVLVATKTTNFSRHSGDGDAKVSTTITIGYDAPWRQVHALLLDAAARTTTVRKDPAPIVLQRALQNFYVEYELVVSLERPEQRLAGLSELHMNIQDAFNEAGVQIMSPAFESQPEEKVIVPKSQWFPNNDHRLKK